MKQSFKKLIITLSHIFGVSALIENSLRHNVTCVGYHSVYDEKNKDSLNYRLYSNISVSTTDFERELVLLKQKGHTFIHFSDLNSHHIQNLNKPTIIFFDDGFKDNILNALPILQKHSIPATIFITAGLIDRTHFLWTLALRHILLRKSVPESDIENNINELKKLSRSDREARLASIYTAENFVLRPDDFDIFMNWDEVRSLPKDLIEVGSHSISHPKLTELNSDELNRELSDSKQILQEKIGWEVSVISYPYGDYNDNVIQIAKNAGYTYGMTNIEGYNSFSYITHFPLEMKRIVPQTNQVITFLKDLF